MHWLERRYVFVVFCMLVGIAVNTSAEAQAIYRCVQKGKPVSLQSQPCDEKSKTTAIRDYVPERAPTSNELAWKRYRTEQEMAARNAVTRQTNVTTVVNVPVDTPSCAQAKADRDAWERRVGLRRTADGMRAWQERVYEACR